MCRPGRECGRGAVQRCPLRRGCGAPGGTPHARQYAHARTRPQVRARTHAYTRTHTTAVMVVEVCVCVCVCVCVTPQLPSLPSEARSKDVCPRAVLSNLCSHVVCSVHSVSAGECSSPSGECRLGGGRELDGRRAARPHVWQAVVGWLGGWMVGWLGGWMGGRLVPPCSRRGCLCLGQVHVLLSCDNARFVGMCRCCRTRRHGASCSPLLTPSGRCKGLWPSF